VVGVNPMMNNMGFSKLAFPVITLAFPVIKLASPMFKLAFPVVFSGKVM
jgi:hypothetical protein